MHALIRLCAYVTATDLEALIKVEWAWDHGLASEILLQLLVKPRALHLIWLLTKKCSVHERIVRAILLNCHFWRFVIWNLKCPIEVRFMNRWASQYILNTSRSLSFSFRMECWLWYSYERIVLTSVFTWEYWVSSCCIVTARYWSILSSKGLIDEELASFIYRRHLSTRNVGWHGFATDANSRVFELPVRVKLLYFKHLIVTWAKHRSPLLRVCCFLSANPWPYRLFYWVDGAGIRRALAHRVLTFKK